MSSLIADAANTNSLAHKFRTKRDEALRAFLLAARPASVGPCRVVDLGGGIAYWERIGTQWLAENGFEITCINHSASELTRDSDAAGQITIKVGDACNLSDFADGSFDIAHSNSVIEHVGDWSRITAFAREVRRLAPAYYIQTPYFWFPIDPHFYRVPLIHWLPPALRARIHLSVRAGWSGPAKDLDKAMRFAESNYMLTMTQMKHLFPDAQIRFERVALLPKSIIASRL